MASRAIDPPQPDAHFFALQEALAGKYSIELELGRGGMGIVYLALDVRLDRPVALKVLPEHMARDPDLRARFLHEARTSAKLSHPNIVPIHSVDEVGDFVFFAMGYVAGETLGERIRRQGPLSPSECTRVLREVGFALSYAHSQGVIHRDIKPDNILIEDGSGRALVADFGIAGIVDDSQEVAEEGILGTVEFMSPEQASGGRLDFRSDLYSLGMVAYYALSGDLPFKSDSVRTTLEHVRSAPVPPVSAVAQSAPRRLARVVDTCLRKDPTDRFESADEFAQALEVVTAAHKQIPVAVRTFLYDPIDLGGDAPAYGTIAAMAALPMVVATVQVPAAAAPVLAAFIAFAVGAPAVLVPPRVRRLIGAGNTIADLELGLRQDLEQRKEEAQQPAKTKFARLRPLLRKASLVGLGGSWTVFWTATLLLGVLGLPFNTEVVTGLLLLLTTGSASAVGFVISSIAPGQEEERRALKKAERRLRFWQSKLGRAIFKLSGVGLHKRVAEVRATHRPTELQIGLAAEALFESLTKETRKRVGDVPAMVGRLESDAQQLRESINLLTEAEVATLPRRSQFPADLRAMRENAETQLSEVVAALETIRLELLRLTAGIGSVEGLTTHLLAAGEVGDDVARVMAGIEEVEAALETRRDVSSDRIT
ncbi:MAG: serine/threonine protein kinase [Gemmatimonadota bacterium]|nr:MAG: serine/threonine protein kinase [Gemmatimonadota bacterium]